MISYLNIFVTAIHTPRKRKYKRFLSYLTRMEVEQSTAVR